MLEYTSVIEIIRSIILIISAILIVTVAIGILRLRDEMDKVIYVRLHMLGVMDIASILALIGLNQPLLAGVYFILAPFLAHAMANAYYYGEYEHKSENIDKSQDKLTSEFMEDS